MKLCGACERLVKGSESACPFCGASVDDAPSVGRHAGPRAATRAVMLVGAAVVGASMAAVACTSGSAPDGGSNKADGGTPSGDDDDTPVPAYGVPSPPPDAGDDDDVTMPLYGLPSPPPDAGADGG